MSDRVHATILIDHREAKSFHIDLTDAEPVVIYSHASGRHLQHKANTTGSGHKGVDKEFFERAIAALAGIDAILITDPVGDKTELKNFMAEHHSVLAKRISAVEALDHPSDGALCSFTAIRTND